MAYEYIYGSDTVEEGTRKINQNFLRVPVAENVLTEANNYADTVGTTTLNSAKSYADTVGATTLNSAKSYADTVGATTLNSAKSYADTVGTTTLNSAKSYADTVGTNTLNSAKTYANTTFSNPNLLINGDFQVWQKGESFNAAGYTADRWRNAQSNTAVTKIQHLQEGLCSKFAIKLTKTKDNGGNIYLHQALEDYKTILKGKTLTVSFWAIGVGGFSGYFGVQIGNTNGTTFNLTNKWTKYQYTVKAVDTSEETDIRRRGVFFYSLGANQPQTGQGLAITEVKLEYGEAATPFVPRMYAEELAMCQRYYYNPLFVGSGYPYLAELCTTTNGGAFVMKFPVSMRAVPTLTGDFSSLYIKNNSGTATAVTTIKRGDGTTQAVGATVTVNATFTANQFYYLQYRSSCPNYKTLAFDAEIY